MRPISALALCAAILGLLAPAGCANTPPTRFYVLSAIDDAPAAVSGKGIAVGIGPVTLSQYLDRPQIVTRIGGNQMEFAEFDQWGGDLDDNVTRVVAANLSNLLKTDRVSLYPWTNEAPIDEQVTIDMVNFEQDADGTSLLTAYWSILDPRKAEVKLMRRSTYRDGGDAGQPTSGSAGASQKGGPHPYDAIVAAMNRNLEALSRDIADAITSLKAK
jgi:uncharacterized lipoprotein YmbA